MFAYTYQKAHPLDQFSIKKTTVPNPIIKPTDVLVRIKATAFNPVDTKIRQQRNASTGTGVILGWDASGIIEAVGDAVKDFKVGDEVFYSGEMMRDGCYSEQQAVDARLIAHKPRNISFEQAAALPLTFITAWEALFEKGFNYTPSTKVLIIGGAGGVGSAAIQLLKLKTKATVIATASRPESADWVKKMGADHVIGRDLKKIGIDQVDILFSTTHTQQYLDVIPEILNVFGHFVLIDDPKSLDAVPFKRKAQSIYWEFMFAKSLYDYHPETQGAFLTKLAHWIEDKKIIPSLGVVLENSEESIKAAHTSLETGTAVGKIVMRW